MVGRAREHCGGEVLSAARDPPDLCRKGSAGHARPGGRVTDAGDCMSRSDEAREVRGRRWTRLVTDRKVGIKIGMAVGAMALAAAGVATAALTNMGAMQSQSDYMYRQTLVPITDLARMQ